eukprot:gene3147-2140_t
MDGSRTDFRGNFAGSRLTFAKNKISNSQSDSSNHGIGEMDPTNGDVNGMFFMKQLEGMGNACGGFAFAHAVANLGNIDLPQDGHLARFLKDVENDDIEQRGKKFAENPRFMNSNNDTATQGQSDQLERDVDGNENEADFHYVAVVPVDGKLVEFDGYNFAAPQVRGTTSTETFKEDGARLIKERFSLDKEGNPVSCLSIIALVRGTDDDDDETPQS